MISLNDVSFKYKNGNLVLESINLEIKEGEIVSIIGKNGTGKSTLLNLMSGLIKPTKGEIFIDDKLTSNKKNFLEIRKNLGMVFQNPDNQILFPRVYDDIEFALKNLKLEDKEERINEALKIVNMSEYKENNTYELSLGQKQRINIASILAIRPKYILLDEPTTMIDPVEKESIYETIRKLKKNGTTIVFVTNNINEILLSDRIIILEEKKIKHIIKKEEILDKSELIKNCNIKLPEIIEIALELKKKGIKLNLKEWTVEEFVKEITGVCKNEKCN